MVGCEETILNAVGVTAASASGVRLRYVEIGCANCLTLVQVCNALERTGRPWEAIGLDLPDNVDGFISPRSWCQDKQEAQKNIEQFGQRVRLEHGISWEWLSIRYGMAISLAMVDGCHEKECVKRDFLALEPMIVPGGCVVFHDTSEWSQGTDPQHHLGQPIEVRKALVELQLLPPLREWWSLVGVADGRESEGGRGCMVYQRRTT